jgi:ribonuclease-3
MINFLDLKKLIGIELSNADLLKTAFTHRSYLNESKEENSESNERLEFLGDSILQFLTSRFLYNKYSKEPEGKLTSYRAAIVNTESLSKEALRMDLGKYLLMSKGEEATGGRTRPYIMANTFEAFLGYLFLEHGIQVCENYLIEQLFYKVESIVTDKKYKDPKSSLQEITQEKFGYTPVYRVINEKGPDHDKTFTAEVIVNNKILATGSGSSKQKAEEATAKKALETLSSR